MLRNTMKANQQMSSLPHEIITMGLHFASSPSSPQLLSSLNFVDIESK